MNAAPAGPPRDYEGLKELLIARRGDLPKRLVQVAAFALENPNEIAFGTVASVAAQARVQPSTLEPCRELSACPRYLRGHL